VFCGVVVVGVVVVVVVVAVVVVVVGVVVVVVVVGVVVVVVSVVDVVVVGVGPHVTKPCWHPEMTSFAHCDFCLPVNGEHDAVIWSRHDGRLHGGGGSVARAADATARVATARNRPARGTMSRMTTP